MDYSSEHSLDDLNRDAVTHRPDDVADNVKDGVARERVDAGGAPTPDALRQEAARCRLFAGVPAAAVDDIAPDDPLLRVKPFVPPTPTRRVGMVWRATFPRHRAIDLVRQALLDCHLPGTQPVDSAGVKRRTAAAKRAT